MSLYSEYDHFNMPIGADGTPYEYMESLRDEAIETSTPIGWSEAYGGFWVCTGWNEMNEIQKNPQAFSSLGVNFPRLATPGERPLMLAGTDEPAHGKYRRLVQSAFTPARAAAMKDLLRHDVNVLMDRFIDDGRVDVVDALTREVPARLTAIILGVSPEDGPQFRTWVHAMAWLMQADPAAAAKHVAELDAYFANLLQERRAHPGDDVLSLVVHSEVDRERLTDEEIKDFFVVLLIGGIDNTIHFLANSFWRMSWDKELRRRLAANPALLAVSVDEFLRMYGPAQAGRIVTEPIEVGGVSMIPGQQVQMVHPIANRDPRQFVNPDVFIPDRTPNRHFALGLGIHRCLGAHLVRVEAQVVMEEFVRRVSDWELDPASKPVWSCGQVAGMISVPIVFEAQKAALV